MSTAMTAQRQDGDKLSAWVSQPEVKQQIAAAVGDVMDGDQFIAHMMVAINRPDFSQCSNASKAMAFLECAALGLLPTAGQVVLIPYKSQLKAMPQWQGYKAIMERHPAILEVQAFLVHARDEFTVKNGQPSHNFDPLDDQRTFTDLKDIRGGYCKIIYRDGRPPRYHFTTAAHIGKARACAQTQSVWKQWFEQMALKTLYRDCYARRAVPIDPLVATRLERVTAAEDVILGNDPRDNTDEAPLASPPRISTLDALAERLEVPALEAEEVDDPTQESPEPSDAVPESVLLEEYQAAVDQAASVAAVRALLDRASHDAGVTTAGRTKLTAACQEREAALNPPARKGRGQKSMLPEDNHSATEGGY